MSQQNQPGKLPQQTPIAAPPTNLPIMDDTSEQEQLNQTAQKEEAPYSQEERVNNVPERNQNMSSFPESATTKIASNPGLNKFGDPEDVVPKGLSQTKLDEAETTNNSEAKPKDPEKDLVKDMTQKNISNTSGENEYAGPSIESLERKELIKKIIVLVIVGVIVIFGAVFAYNKWLKKPVSVQETVEVQDEAPLFEEDIDEDGLPNEWEEQYGLNPNDAGDGEQDPDFDRLTNIKEYEYGTNPKKSDSDGDGYKDGEEVQGGYNPNGSGKLNDSNNQANYYPTIKGQWQGTMTGAAYSSEIFEITLQSNGNVSGNLEYAILNTDDRSLVGELDGVFSFKKETNIFSSKINSDAEYKEGKKTLTRGQFNLNLNGTLKDGQQELSGTWVLEPITDIFWLKQDRGNFLLRKTSDL